MTVTATSAVQAPQTVSTTAIVSATATGIGTYSGNDDWSNLLAYYKLEGSGPIYADSTTNAHVATAAGLPVPTSEPSLSRALVSWGA